MIFNKSGGGIPMNARTNAKTILNALVMIMLFLTSIVAVAAVPPSAVVDIPGVVVEFVKINGDEVTNGGDIKDTFERGEKISIRLKIASTTWPGAQQPACLDANNNPIRDQNNNIVVPDANGACANGVPGVFTPINAAEDVRNAAVLAWITGDEHFPLVQVSETFDLEAKTRDDVEFELQVPQNLNLEDGDEYKLNLLVSARGLSVAQYQFDLKIEAQRHNVVIRDVVISPSRQVLAGRPFTVMARVQNLGEKDEEGIKIVAKVPAFGLAAESADFIDQIDGGSEDDSVTSEQIYLRIPADAKPGIYDVVVEALYDDYTKKETTITKIEVVNPSYQDAAQPGEQPAEPQSSSQKGKTVITVGPEMQDVVKGQGGAIYPVTIANQGAVAKNYVVGVTGTEPFATVQLSPSNVVTLESGASETVYVYVSAREDAQVGAHTFAVEVRAADKLLQQMSLTANVVEGSTTAPQSDLRRGLEVGLIVLIVVLIVLGLVIAFARSRKGDGEEPLAGQAYY